MANRAFFFSPHSELRSQGSTAHGCFRLGLLIRACRTPDGSQYQPGRLKNLRADFSHSRQLKPFTVFARAVVQWAVAGKQASRIGSGLWAIVGGIFSGPFWGASLWVVWRRWRRWRPMLRPLSPIPAEPADAKENVEAKPRLLLPTAGPFLSCHIHACLPLH